MTATRRALWALRVPLACLVLFAVAEGGVRAGDPTAALLYAESEDFAVLRWHWRRQASAHRERSLILLGNSGTRDAVDLAELERRTGTPSFNWGMAGEALDGLVQVPLAPTRHGVLVLGLNSVALDYRHDPNPHHPWRLARLGSHFMALRAELVPGAEARVRRFWDDDPVQTGREPRAVQYSDDLSPQDLTRRWAWIETEIASHPPRPRSEAELAALLERLRMRAESAGYVFAVAWLPERPESPYGRSLGRRVDVARGALERAGVPQFVPSHVPGWDSFRDAVHLNARGRAWLAGELADWLDAEGLLP